MDEEYRYRIKHNIKDSIFVNFFGDRENVLELYRELHPEDTSSTVEDVKIRTVKRVVTKGFTNDLGFSVGNRYICLVEAQSYRLSTIQMRMMFYLAETYQNYLDELNATVYDVGEGELPIWEAYIVSSADSNEGIYRLRSIGSNLMDESAIEQVTIDEQALLEEYIKACNVIDIVISGEHDESHRCVALEALEACKDQCGRIGEYIWSRRSEVMGVYQQLFDDEENLKMLKKAYEKIGLEKGLEQGLKQGTKQGMEKGIVIGKEEEKKKIALKMLSKNMSPEEVSEMTDIPLEDVIRLASETEE